MEPFGADGDDESSIIELFLHGQGCENEGDTESAASVYEHIVENYAGQIGLPYLHVHGESSEEDDVPPALVYSCTLNSLGGLYLDIEMLDKAKELFEKSTKAWPRNAMAILNIANMERECGDFHAALRLYEAIIDNAPSAEEVTRIEGSDNGTLGWERTYIYGPLRQCLEQAHYLCALGLHQVGQYRKALQFVKMFNVRYRIHPHVWDAANRGGQGAECVEGTEETKARRPCKGTPPELYARAVPPKLKLELCSIFAKNSQFWAETDYHERGYYSFWYDLSEPPSNTVEDFIRHFLPLVEKRAGAKIVGAEWWVHSRPIGRNLGHQLHLDTEENTLEASHEIVHPKVSSVTYLSPPVDGGDSTVVFDQRLGDDEASHAYIVKPCESGFMMFDGDKIHGVLPSSPSAFPIAGSKRQRTQGVKGKLHRKVEQPHRLTLMVGWWNKDVRKVGKRTLLGPCGPVPSRPTRNCKWPGLLQSPYHFLGADEKREDSLKAEQSRAAVPINVASPAWEKIPGNDDARTTTRKTLEIPTAVDQRFFLNDFEEFRVHLLERALGNQGK